MTFLCTSWLSDSVPFLYSLGFAGILHVFCIVKVRNAAKKCNVKVFFNVIIAVLRKEKVEC